MAIMLRVARLCGAFRPFSHALSTHQNTAYNNADTPFEFTDESYKQIERVMTKYPKNYKRSAVISLLYIAQKQNNNWVPLSAMNKIAKILDMSEIDVYEVASFYTMFNRTPVGKYHLQVCGTTPCMVRGARDIIKAIEQDCGIVKGQTSKDGLFTLVEVECLGACANAPMMQVNNEHFYEDLTPESVKSVLDKFRKGEMPTPGPQSARNKSEGPSGRTTLKEVQEVKHTRDFAKAKADYEVEKQERAAKAAEAMKKAKEAEAERAAKAAAAKPPPPRPVTDDLEEIQRLIAKRNQK